MEKSAERRYPDIGAGWQRPIALAAYLLDDARLQTGQRRKLGRVHQGNGHAAIEVRPNKARTRLDEMERGILLAAEEMTAEICDVCGRPGLQWGGPDEMRIVRCLEHNDKDKPWWRWTWEQPVDPRTLPGYQEPKEQWNQGYVPVSQWSEKRLGVLMTGRNDDEAAHWWQGGRGWIPIWRAALRVLIPLERSTPDEHGWRSRGGKEKWGSLNLEGFGGGPTARGITLYLETWSAHVCIHCGDKATMRRADWVRPECERCWTTARAKDHASDASNQRDGYGDTTTISAGFMRARRIFERETEQEPTFEGTTVHW